MSTTILLLQALTFLVAAVVMVPLAKKLGLGSVLGYLIAGIVIGPTALGLVGTETKDVMHIAEFGVVMMLFVIGLELEPLRLWKLRGPILGTGGAQVLVTTLALGAAALFFGLEWRESLAIGMICALSSTAMVLQSLQERGLMKSEAGQRSFSVLLFQDIAVIPILAILPLLVHLETGQSGSHADHGFSLLQLVPEWAGSLVVLASIALVVVLGRYMVRPLLRFVAASGLREVFTASTLLLVILVAVLMLLVGLSPALGAFLAGVMLANSEYRHELETDIEPFKGLLLGLFFVAVGASIDFRLVASNAWAVAGLTIGLMVAKFGILVILGRLAGLKGESNITFSISLAQLGEFAFVLLAFSRDNGILRDDTVALFIAVVAISMALTPVALLLNDKLIRPRLLREAPKEERPHDEIDEASEVIIAGFGRFGNIVGRFLKANGVQTTALDHDSDRVDLLRRFGYRVYYGDAARADLLRAAGAESAKLIVVAVGPPEKALEVIKVVKHHFPHLHIVVRAYDRSDAFDFMDEGILHVFRESLDSSLRVGVHALTLLGRRTYAATRAAHLFQRHDESVLKKLAAVRHDRPEFISTAREAIAELEDLIQSDIQALGELRDAGWDSDSIRSDYATKTSTPGSETGG